MAARNAAPARPAGWLAAASGLGTDGTIAIMAMVIAAGPFLRQISSTPGGEELVLGYWTLLTAVLAYRLWSQFGQRWTGWALTRLWPMMLVLAAALASPLWSLTPELSATRALWLAETTFLGFFVGFRFRPPEMMGVLLGLFLIVLIGSVLFVVLLPDVAVEGARGGSWRGIMPFKNELGFMAAAAIAFFLIGVTSKRLPAPLAWAFLVLALFVLFRTKSASGIVVAVSALALVLLLWMGRRFRVTALLAVIIVAVSPLATVFSVMNLETIVGWLDRDTSLTGRTEAWADAIQVIEAAPLHGFGLQAVWGHGAQTWFPDLPATKALAHAHNGYLNLATDLGVPVASVATFHILWVLLRSFATYINTRSSIVLYIFVYLQSFVLFNMVESRLYQFRRLEWVLCVMLVVSLLRELYPPTPVRRSCREVGGTYGPPRLQAASAELP
jgi:exopolysaccharide production protein ExoQ